MEHTITIKLPEQDSAGVAENFEALLFDVLNANSETIGYLIQDYYPREKVRGVVFDKHEIRRENEHFVAKATFTLEQFSVCAAIDTMEKSSMLMSASIAKNGNLVVAGERILE